MSVWSSLWNHRNEPVLVLLSVAVVGLMGIAVILALLQFFFRAAPLICNDIWLPTSSEECSGISPSDPSTANFPVGVILPFFGRDEDIPDGWVVCDGRDIPADSNIVVDANAKKGGLQLPDLRERFVRGAATELSKVGIRTGGSDAIDLEHSHLWAEKVSGHWYSFENKEWKRVDDWSDGIGDSGKGNRPLSNDSDLVLHTDNQGSKSTSILPAYVELRYIIRVR